MHPNFKKLKMSSNKEMTLNGDLDTMILLKIDLTFTQNQLEELFGVLFDKDKTMMMNILDDDYLRLIQVKEQNAANRRALDHHAIGAWDERRNAD